jgi:hypothetical protein
VKEGTLSQPCPKGENDLGWDMKWVSLQLEKS